ncbi:DUF4256 domain-containing protein [Flavobacterium sp.]|uniref:DUF4256 domain-containing protein n=1 Tax=Flavobacterium sp. TaxID=239 RepID=UPI003D0C4BEE
MKILTQLEKQQLLQTLQKRFLAHPERHLNVTWEEVIAKLESQPNKLYSLFLMEETGGEPDVIGKDELTGAILFCDCSPESPKGRRSLCYDTEALNSRKENKPENSACAMAQTMGIELLEETQYRKLQSLGAFDLKTSTWLKTPEAVRKLGGAIFGDCRYDTVFVYHNGASSYYAARGFRGMLFV